MVPIHRRLFHGLSILGNLNLTALTLPLTLAKEVEKVHFFFFLNNKSLKIFLLGKGNNYHNVAFFLLILFITSWEIDAETVETVSDFISLGSKITADGIEVMKLKDAYSLEGKL